MPKVQLSICMPIYNEASGIREFISEIVDEFDTFEIAICVVDDYSSDDSLEVLKELNKIYPVRYIKNDRNLGHGPSTVEALRFAYAEGSPYVLAVDGDGQFHARDMRQLVEKCLESHSQVGLGIRIRSNEPLYRKYASWVTRFLIRIKTKNKTLDANTPLRFYSRESLEILLKDLDTLNPIPNLFITSSIYRQKLTVENLYVHFRERRGNEVASTSWGNSLWRFPSKRFIKFCVNSILYWIKN